MDCADALLILETFVHAGAGARRAAAAHVATCAGCERPRAALATQLIARLDEREKAR